MSAACAWSVVGHQSDLGKKDVVDRHFDDVMAQNDVSAGHAAHVNMLYSLVNRFSETTTSVSGRCR